MSKESVMLCWRVADIAAPLVQSTVEACATCGAAVWHANSSPASDRILCMTCGYQEYQNIPGATMLGPTKRQLRDLRKALE